MNASEPCGCSPREEAARLLRPASTVTVSWRRSDGNFLASLCRTNGQPP
jgi:hypothetical protein